MYRIVDGQVQRDGTVGAMDVLKGLDIVAARGVGLLIPSVGLAGRGHKLVGGGVIDGQVQSIDLRTAVGVIVRVGVVAAGGVGLTVTGRPGVGLHSGDGGGGIHRMVDGEVQRHGAVAACGVGQREGRLVGAFSVGLTVDPREGLASLLLVNALGDMVDGQVQRVDLRTAVGILVAVGVVAADGVGLAVAGRPSVGLASRGRQGGVYRIVDGQMQRHHTVAACRIGQRVGRRVGALSVGHTVNPFVAFTSRLLVDAGVGIVHCEDHGHYRVAAVGGRQHKIPCTCFIEHFIIPCVGQFCLTDGSFFRMRNVAFLNHKVVQIVTIQTLVFTTQNNISSTCIANRQSVSVPAIHFFSRDHCIVHFSMIWDEGQFCGTFNLAISACIDSNTIGLIVPANIPMSGAEHIKEEVVVVCRNHHFRKHQFPYHASMVCIIPQLFRGIAAHIFRAY